MRKISWSFLHIANGIILFAKHLVPKSPRLRFLAILRASDVHLPDATVDLLSDVSLGLTPQGSARKVLKSA